MFTATRDSAAAIFFVLSLVCFPALAEHDGEYDSEYSIEVTTEVEDSPSLDVQAEARSILDLDENQLEQVITTTLELQAGEKKKTVRISVPSAIADSTAPTEEAEENLNQQIGKPIGGFAPVTQSSLGSPSPGGWIAVLNPMRWAGLAQRSVSSTSTLEAENSATVRKAQRLTEIERSSNSGIGLGSVKSKPAAKQSLDQKIASFFERFRNAFGRAQAKREGQGADAEQAEEVILEDRGVGSVSPDRPVVYHAAMAPGAAPFAENGENPVGITVIAILGWLGFLFCVFLMYRLRFTAQKTSRSSSSRRSEGRKTWRSSYPNGETVVNPTRKR